jgi:hypothetical protein
MDHESSGLVSIDRQPRRATLRSFALALALLCLARGIWSWTNSAYTTAMIASSLGVAFASVAVLRPNVLHRPYVLLGVMSFPLRWLLSYLVLAAVYFAVITPVACGVRIARKLRTRDETPDSHWRHSPPRGDKPSYFRQF